ncbi:hypothetical protein GCM10027051_10910 [Niabella terrae]
MFNFLKNHPFAVEAFFERSIVLSFAIPKAEAAALIPECLLPDCLEDQWAFIAVALVQTRNLRPRGFPRWTGQDFHLTGYRVFVRYTNPAGKRLRGLYILKSETNRRRMEIAGNLFTHYKYTTTDIQTTTHPDGSFHIDSAGSGFRLSVSPEGNEPPALPEGSPFPDWKTARRFAGPLPFTFSYDKVSRKVLIIEGVRQHWRPEPIGIKDYHFPFLTGLPISSPRLANAFVVRSIPYYWKKGKKEIWHP